MGIQNINNLLHKFYNITDENKKKSYNIYDIPLLYNKQLNFNNNIKKISLFIDVSFIYQHIKKINNMKAYKNIHTIQNIHNALHNYCKLPTIINNNIENVYLFFDNIQEYTDRKRKYIRKNIIADPTFEYNSDNLNKWSRNITLFAGALNNNIRNFYKQFYDSIKIYDDKQFSTELYLYIPYIIMYYKEKYPLTNIYIPTYHPRLINFIDKNSTILTESHIYFESNKSMINEADIQIPLYLTTYDTNNYFPLLYLNDNDLLLPMFYNYKKLQHKNIIIKSPHHTDIYFFNNMCNYIVDKVCIKKDIDKIKYLKLLGLILTLYGTGDQLLWRENIPFDHNYFLHNYNIEKKLKDNVERLFAPELLYKHQIQQLCKDKKYINIGKDENLKQMYLNRQKILISIIMDIKIYYKKNNYMIFTERVINFYNNINNSSYEIINYLFKKYLDIIVSDNTKQEYQLYLNNFNVLYKTIYDTLHNANTLNLVHI